MADARPFRALRYDPVRVDLALTIAPPYDIISPEQQAALYQRSGHNIVRVEYGEQRPGDSAADNRYTRAAADLGAWERAGVLVRDTDPAVYAYTQTFEWAGRRHERRAYFAAVRLEEWDKGIIKPHEHTLAGPKADRLDLLRATRTQVSPVYSLFRPRAGAPAMPPLGGGDELCDFQADGQRHALTALTDPDLIGAFGRHLAACDVYIADGHHRYETALRYRDEARALSTRWTGDEPRNFVLMALTDAADPGLLVLPTHRVVSPPSFPGDADAHLAQHFTVTELRGDLDDALEHLQAHGDDTAFIAIGLVPERMHLLVLRDRGAVEALMPARESEAWKRLDVNVLQYGVLQRIFAIDDDALTAGAAVAYTQDAREAQSAVAGGAARLAFLLNATPVEQVLAVADAGGRMPQKSTYFYPKLPTGLVMNPVT